ncbi:MAG: hypothetical protein ACREBV_07975, partial [Candidatus Zixiibacteriota bacterium]
LKGKERNMKKLTLLTVFLLVAMAGSSVMADVGSAFGTQATAQSVGHRVGYFGVGVGIADFTSVVGTFDYGLSKFTTGRLKLGFTDDGDNADMALSMGAEVRWQIWRAGGVNKRPVDLAVGPMIEYFKIGSNVGPTNFDLSVFQFGGFVMGSHGFMTSGGNVVTPYAKLNVRVEDVKLEVTGFGDVSESDLRVGLGTGVAYQMTKTMNLYGELQFDGNNGVFLGVDFKVM